jgi:N-acetylglucosamine-6-phosphate deacetylase
MRQAISGARIFTGDSFLESHSLILQNGRINGLIRDEALGPEMPVCQLNGGILAPGFIDVQVNGGGDVLFNNDTSPEGLAKMMAGHRRFGTTGMMPTLISDDQAVLVAGVEAVKAAKAQKLPGILGVHIEGPFFSPAKRGTHKASWIRPPEAEDIQWLSELGELRTIVTLAPEHTRKGQIQMLSDAGVLVCAGHTNALAADIDAAIGEGLRGFTHLFNAMRPMEAREPGVVGAALDDPHTWCGLIADGHHVHPTVLRLAIAAKTKGKMLLVTDSMSTIGGQQNAFELYEETIREQNGKLVNAEGNLAGSAISMIDAVKYTHLNVGVPLDECLRMASLYPAEFLHIQSQRGRIENQFEADLVHFDEKTWRVQNTWISGQQQSH